MLYTSGTTGKPKGVCQTHARVHRRRDGRLRVRRPERRRQHALVPADGVGRRPSFFVRADVRCGLHHQLPGIRRHGADRYARDRADLLFRAAARVREPADAGDDPHGGRGRAEALAVPVLHRRRAPLRRRDPRPARRRARRRPPALRARQRARLRAAAQRARHEPDPRRLHGGRGDRPRPVPLLPLDRRQPEAALRLDRDLRLRVPAARRRRQARHRRPAGARRRAQDRRHRARSWCAARCCSRSTTSDPTRPPRRSTRTASSTPATPAIIDDDGHLKIIDRAKDVGSSPTARCSRPTTSRTSSSSSPTSRKRLRSATAATRSARSSTSTWAPSATGPSGATSPTPATPTSPPSPRSTR